MQFLALGLPRARADVVDVKDSRVVQGSSGWFRVVQGGSGWFRVIQGGLGWFRVVQGGSRWDYILEAAKSKIKTRPLKRIYSSFEAFGTGR